MTNLILHERSYAGNPHIRFDGGVVSERPRRGPLLYNRLAVFALALSAAISCQKVFADPQGKFDNGVYTIEVKGGDPDLTLNNDDVSALGADNTLLKTGKGRLIINCNLGATYDGEIIVREGFLRATSGGSGGVRGLGGTAKGTFVENGATLEMIGSGSDECANGEPLTFEGAGVDGCGAVYRVSGCNTGYGLFAGSTITMTGDATVGSKTSGYWFRVRNTSINMNGHELTFQNDDTVNGFKGGGASGPVANPGNIIVAEGACFALENDASKIGTGSEANRIILKANSRFVQRDRFVSVGGNRWTIQVDGAAQLELGGTTSGNYSYGWNGPITLNDTLTIAATSTAFPFTFNGAISGAGALAYSGAGRTVMNGDVTRAHTYTGGTTFSDSCNVTLATPGLLPLTAGAVTVGATAKILFQPQVASDTALFTDEAVSTISRVLTAGGAGRMADVVIAGRDDTWPESFTDKGALSGTAEEPLVYSSYLTNAEMRITGEMSGFVNLAVRPKTTIRLATSGVTESWTEVNGGTLVIPAGVTLTASNRVYVGGADNANIGRLKVEGTLDLNSDQLKWRGIAASSQALSSNVRATERGIVEIAAGGVVNGYLGLDQGGCQMPTAQDLYLIKGTVVGVSTETFVGDFRNEYLEIADGGVYSNAQIRAGRGTGYANIRVKTGGRLRGLVDRINIIRTAYNGGATDLLVDGGSIYEPDSGFVLNAAEGAQTGAYSSVTVCDGGEVRFPTPTSGEGWTSATVNNTKNSVSYLNLLDGGLLEASTLLRNKDREGNRCVISFDGGTYAMRYNNLPQYQNQKCFGEFQAGEGSAGDHVFVFSKGAAISNDTPTCVGFSLEPPMGKGVESIAVPEEIAQMAAWVLPGPPMVRIIDSTGYGASAVALYDAERGKVTAIKVTSRGVNYTNPTIAISHAGLADAKSYTGCCTLTENDTSGGFTKLGKGVLTVDQVCTYTGRTVLAGGTLKLDVDGALPAASRFVLAGGKLDMNGKTLGGGSTQVMDWGADVRLALENGTATYDNLEFPAGATMTVTGAKALLEDPERDPKGIVLIEVTGNLVNKPALVVEDAEAIAPWQIRWVGKRLLAGIPSGILLIVR